MTVKNWIHWITLPVILILTTSCASWGTKQVEVSSKPIQIDIIQPTMPRAIDLKEPVWHVVSTAKIANPCVKNEEGKRPRTKQEDGSWVCDLGKENPDWPEGYTYLDRFLDEVKKKNNGDIVFFAISVEDYELMAYNMQELRRYIREVQEVVVYYRNVTLPNGEQAVGGKIEVKKD